MKKIINMFCNKFRYIHRGVYGFTFLFVLLFAFKFQAQTYPVQISAQLVPPYSGYLPDYADPSAEKLKVILKFNDFSQPQYDIKLKFEIKGNGFTLSTKTFFNPPPITLIPGQPLLISGNDLAPYLNANNLDFVGINQSQYQQRMSLPEGYYSICIKAYDYNNSTPIQLSNEACAQAWFTLSDPPYLNLPLCGTYLTPLNPQNIIFQWTPINLGSPLSALNTEYEFALYECRPDSNANPNQIVLSTAPIFSTTTQQTFINYGITEPPLNLYMKYVWRVRAKDITGRDLFKNQGYSQICTFTYGTLKNVLGNSIGITLTANEINHRSGECSFNKQSIYSNYLLQVRKKGTLNWFNFPNTTGYERVSNLEPNTTYECRVRGEQPMAGEWSNTAEFTTYAAPNYACNTNTMPVSPNATQPLPVNKAVLGMIIQSGQFEVIATEIKSNNIPGWYRGKGYAIVFGGFPVAVKWDNIFIDVDQKQQQGIIEAMTKGVEAWEHEHDLELAEEHPIEFGGTIDSIYISGGQVCCMLEGNTTPTCVTLPENKNIVVVRDANGNQYEINMVPPPPKITGPKSYLPISDDTLSASSNFQVVFEKSNTQKYGFDKRPLTSTSKDYEFIKLNDGASYFVPYKSIGEGGTDEVIATYSISNFEANKLEFRTMSGAVITKSLITNQFKLTGIPDNATCVYAYYDSKKIGKINIVSLKPISKKLMIVSVNGATLNQTVTAQEINKVYAQANVSWSVTAAPAFTFDMGQDGLEGADANLLTKYSAEMRALRDAYKQAHSDYNKEAYYVFVVPAFKDANLRGYMVRGRALGFVTASATVKEVTHELAHGAFGLEHTFPEVEKGSTSNLLDYGSGVDLNRGQWEGVQNPKSINWMDDEEDAAILGMSNCNINNLPNEIKVFYTHAYNCSNNVADEFAAYIRLKGTAANLYINSFCVDTRIKLIKCLLNGIVGEDDENAILALIETTPTNELPALKAWLSINDYELYLKLEKEFNDAGIGQKSYTKLTQVLCDLLGKGITSNRLDQIIRDDLVFEYQGSTNYLKSILNFRAENFLTRTNNNIEQFERIQYYYTIVPNSETKLSFIENKQKDTYSDGGTTGLTCSPCKVTYPPKKIKDFELFDLIAIIPKKSPNYNDFTFPDNQIKIIPALYFKWLEKKNYNQNLEDIGYATAGAISMVVGVGELGAAVEAGKYLKAVMPAAEILFGAGTSVDAISNGAYTNFLEQNLTTSQYNAYKIAETTVNVIALYKLARANFKVVSSKITNVSQNLYDNLKTSSKFFKDLKSQFPDKYNKLKAYFQKTLGKNIDEIENSLVLNNNLSKAFNKGFKFDDIVKEFEETFNSVGQRINGKFVRPYQEYLDNAFCTNHKNKFMTEGGAMLVRRNRDVTKSPFVGFVQNKFVGLKSEMDKLVVDFNKSGKNYEVLKEKLALTDDWFEGVDELYIVYIKPELGFNFDIPSGNEFGAFKGLWKPGGYTANGLSEAIVPNMNENKFKHFNSWDNFKTIFGAQNVVKIK
jgi:hypothetical protein